MTVSEIDAFLARKKNGEDIAQAFHDSVYELLKDGLSPDYVVRHERELPLSSFVIAGKARTPDIVVYRREPSRPDTFEDVRFLVEVSTCNSKETEKAWKDCMKYGEGREMLRTRGIGIVFVSLCAPRPEHIRLHGETLLQNWAHDPNLARWTVACFMRSEDSEEIPWWLWLSREDGVTDHLFRKASPGKNRAGALIVPQTFSLGRGTDKASTTDNGEDRPATNPLEALTQTLAAILGRRETCRLVPIFPPRIGIVVDQDSSMPAHIYLSTAQPPGGPHK